MLSLMRTLARMTVIHKIDDGKISSHSEENPLKRSKYSNCLKSTAGTVVAVPGWRKLSTKSDEACKPEDHRDDFDGGNHKAMRQSREEDRGCTKVRGRHERCPAA